jgi:anti-sigma B factor antagonist
MADDAGQRVEPVLGVDTVDGGVVVHLAGELDLYNADIVRAALADAIATRPQRLVVDLTQVEFLDSTALGALIEARSKLGKGGLALACPGAETRRALQVSGLDRHLPVHDTVDAALAAGA